MFTEVAHRQHLHQFSPAPPHYSGFADQGPDPLLFHNTNPDSRNTSQDFNCPQSFPKPLQNTQAVQSLSLHPSVAPKAVQLSVPRDESEHILRRKTPSGTLAAGYDGSAVEWMSKPHSNKRMLITGPDTSRHAVYQIQPVGLPTPAPSNRPRTLSRLDETRHSGWSSSPATPQGWFDPRMPLEGGDLGNQQWRPNGIQPSLDSMLYQAPQPQSFYGQGGYPQVPTILQPMWPPSVGPTTSNSQGPYGPYWPYGSYEPYRPAALRDSRFHSQFANSQRLATVEAGLETFPSVKRRKVMASPKTGPGRREVSVVRLQMNSPRHRKPSAFRSKSHWLSPLDLIANRYSSARLYNATRSAREMILAGPRITKHPSQVLRWDLMIRHT